MLRLVEVTKKFGGVTAVNSVSLNIEVGMMTGLVGPNGAGKSTLFSVVAGQSSATSGQIEFDGARIDGATPEEISQRGIGRTFQTTRLFAGLSVLDNTIAGGVARGSTRMWEDLFGSRHRQRERKELENYSREVLTMVGLGDLADTGVQYLSYGQQRLAEIARALVSRPRLMLLDEPAAGLNTAEAERLGYTLTDLLGHLGIGIVLVEHNLPMVAMFCSKIAVLDFGELIAYDVPEVVLKNQRVLTAYVGESAIV